MAIDKTKTSKWERVKKTEYRVTVNGQLTATVTKDGNYWAARDLIGGNISPQWPKLADAKAVALGRRAWPVIFRI